VYLIKVQAYTFYNVNQPLFCYINPCLL